MTPRPNLTRRQSQVLDFIRFFREENGIAPTLLEIGEALGVNRVTIFEHVKALESKGWIRTSKNLSRSIEIIEEETSGGMSTGLPVLGRIAAGQPIDAVEDREVVDLTEMFPAESGLFVLRVQGDSMIEDQIRDGDMVVCSPRSSAEVGETVVALVDGAEATLKRFYPMGKEVRLEPRNPALEPIIVPADSCRIQGVVVGVLRRY